VNKKTIYLFAGIFGSLGAYLPVLAGVDDGFGGWSILGGLVGGIFGIWAAVVLQKRFG
jgi:hypothetical protein